MIIYDVLAKNSLQTLETADLLVKNYLINNNNIIIYLIGDLGAGKTTFVRGIVASLGFNGSVKSPTYTIVESYLNLTKPVYHFDLYRLESAAELEIIGIRDYLGANTICCFEWPDKGEGHIPEPNFTVNFSIINSNSRKIIINKYE